MSFEKCDKTLIEKYMAETDALIKEIDLKGKSGSAGLASEGDLLMELISGIIH